MSSERRSLGHWSALFGAVAVAGTLSASARADSLACSNRIVSTGDSRYEVKAVCGEPDDAWQRVEYRTVSGRVARDCSHDGQKVVCSRTRERVVEVVIDEWVYDFGKNRFIQYLSFEQGRLVTVRAGSYGHKPAK